MMAAVALCALIAGWLLDYFVGDPAWLPHPVVWMGKWISYGEARWNVGNDRVRRGAYFAVGSIVGVFMIMAVALWLLPWPIDVALTVVVVFFCLAGHTLRKEVRMVFEAVDRSVDEGRKQVARIVGRDTAELDAQEIRTAALETLAENLSDGVVAPLFWLLVLGVPGMLAYKMVNTLDSMIGYQNDRFRDFGRWAAKIDDVANYIPARLTAQLMLVAAWLMKKMRNPHFAFFDFDAAIEFVKKYGPEHASPNSGWPEAALAYLLGCRFGGPHYYFGEYFYKPFIGYNNRQLNTGDLATSISVCFKAELLMLAFVIMFKAVAYLLIEL